ncbi:MAG: hypothetical protein ABWY68_00290 [Cryobacterium sp.]
MPGAAREHVDTGTHGTMNLKTGLNTAWESNYRVVRQQRVLPA